MKIENPIIVFVATLLFVCYLSNSIYLVNKEELNAVASMFSILGALATVIAAYFAISTFTHWKKVQKHSEKITICKEISTEIYQLTSIIFKMTDFVLTLDTRDFEWYKNQCFLEEINGSVPSSKKFVDWHILEKNQRIKVSKIAFGKACSLDSGVNKYLFSEYIRLSSTIEGKLEYLSSIGVSDNDILHISNILGTLVYIGDSITSGKFEPRPEISSIIARSPFVGIASDGISWFSQLPAGTYARTHYYCFIIVSVDWRFTRSIQTQLKIATDNLILAIEQ